MTATQTLQVGPTPYPIEEMSVASKERRLLDPQWTPEEELEQFKDWIEQHPAENEAWQTRFYALQLEAQVRALLARGERKSRAVREFNELAGELFLHEEEARLVAHLRPWAFDMVEAPDWEHPSTHELWRRFQMERDAGWSQRRAYLALGHEAYMEASRKGEL